MGKLKWKYKILGDKSITMKVGRKITGNKEEATKMIYVGKSCREICNLIIKN